MPVAHSHIITNRFSVAETLYGHEVIDSDGRPVTDPLEWNTANTARDSLNEAALHGPRAIQVALGAIEEDLDIVEEYA